jgi:holo-[acyl-carrier protein] synthase
LLLPLQGNTARLNLASVKRKERVLIAGIGTDIVAVERFSAWQKDARLIQRFFHADECAAFKALTGERAREYLAGRFAAKEAFGKALGTGLRGLRLSDICVTNDENGKPVMSLLGSAAAHLQKSGAARVLVSISHGGGFAIAFVVLET